MPSIPGLNTRETSLVVWVGGFLLVCLFRADVRSGIGGILKTLASHWFLPTVLLTSAAWVAASALLLRAIGSWDGEMTKVAALWFIGAAIAAVFSTRRTDTAYYSQLALHYLTLPVIVLFIANLHTFPLAVELVLVPLAFIFVMMDVVATGNPDFAPAKKLVGWCLTLLGLASLSLSLVYLAEHFDDVVSGEKVATFLLPFLLTAYFLPYLVLLRYVTVWQTMLHMVRYGLHGNRNLYLYARRSIIGACGLSLARVQEFDANYRGKLWGATDPADVQRVVHEFESKWAWRNDPPPNL